MPKKSKFIGILQKNKLQTIHLQLISYNASTYARKVKFVNLQKLYFSLNSNHKNGTESSVGLFDSNLAVYLLFITRISVFH